MATGRVDVVALMTGTWADQYLLSTLDDFIFLLPVIVVLYRFVGLMISCFNFFSIQNEGGTAMVDNAVDEENIDADDDDPYSTPGLITAFRLLSPTREPVFASTARSVSGALAELERQIGPAIYSSYVGYNGRAPGRPLPKSSKANAGAAAAAAAAAAAINGGATASASGARSGTSADDEQDEDGREAKAAAASPARAKSAPPASGPAASGDARHTLVAYFQIVELAELLDVDKDTVDMAVRVFRHVAAHASLRNKSVEALAAASVVVAGQRRRSEARLHALKRSQLAAAASSARLSLHTHSLPPRKTDRASSAANLEISDRDVPFVRRPSRGR